MTTSNPKQTSRKEIAVSFLRQVVARNIRGAYANYVSPEMKHHNAYFPGDAASLEQGMVDAHTKFPNTTIDIKMTLEDGDLVATFSHVCMQPGDPGVAVVHIFRIPDRHIVEMWDVGQVIQRNSPNQNGIF